MDTQLRDEGGVDEARRGQKEARKTKAAEDKAVFEANVAGNGNRQERRYEQLYSDACGERADSLSTTRIQSVRFGVVWSVWSLATESLRLCESSLSQSNSQTEGLPSGCGAGREGCGVGVRSVGRSAGWNAWIGCLGVDGWIRPSGCLPVSLPPTHGRGGRWTDGGSREGGRVQGSFMGAWAGLDPGVH